MAEKMNYCPECGKLYEVKVTECKACKTALEEANKAQRSTDFCAFWCN